MGWRPVDSLVLTHDWQFTIPVYGNIFRLKHTFSYSPNRYMRALICQANGELDEIELFQIKKVYPKDEYDVYEFARPEIFATRRLGFRLSRSNRIGVFPTWRVTVEEDYYDPDKHFVYFQMHPAYQWRVTHNMNRYPSVATFDEVGEVIEGDIEYVSTMEVWITFSREVLGKVVLD